MKLKKTEKTIIIIVVALLLAALLAFLGIRAWFRLPAGNYYKVSEKAFPIQGLDEGFIPQGICYVESSGDFLVSGYMQDGSASPIYVVEKSTGKMKKKVYVKLDDKGQVQYNGHSGGIAYANKYVYLADGGGHQILVLDRSLVYLTSDGKNVPVLGTIKLESENGDSVTPSFLTVDGDTLYVGEFYSKGKYEKPESHHITTTAGADNHALLVGFQLIVNSDHILGVAEEPYIAYSMTEKIQGASMYQGKFFLSQSQGAAISHIKVYEKSKAPKEGEITVLGKSIALYALDSASEIKDVKIPPMSEEIQIVDGKMYTMCEFASNKYFFGKLTGANWCYATDVEKMLK